MAQNVTIAGNQYPDVPSILVPKTGGGGNAIFADPSVVTAVAADVASGKYFLDSSGVLTQGTASGGGVAGAYFYELVQDNDGIYVPNVSDFTDIAAAQNDGKAIYGYNNATAIFASTYYYDNYGDGFTEALSYSYYESYSDPNNWNNNGINTICVTYGYKNNVLTTEHTDWITYDTSNATAVPSDVTNGDVFYNTSGYQVGTSSAIVPSGTINITSNNTYDVTNYASAVVNVSGGGSSSWTLVASTSYQVSTTGTSATTVATWATGHSELWTSDKIVYVRIRDTAGKRRGYFYGTDTFFLNSYPANEDSSTSNNSSNIIFTIWSYANQGKYNCRYGYSTTGYGVFSDTFYTNGDIRIRARYNSNYSLTVNGTYSVAVYLLDPPTGAPIFT